jgi:hypothetical protein
MTALTAAALTAAMTWPSAFWPTVVPQGFTRFGVQHIVPLHWLSFHLAVVRHQIRGVPGYLLHHLEQLRTG